MKRHLPPFVYAQGRSRHLYCYPKGKRGGRVRMHEKPGTPEFFAEYTRIMQSPLPVPAGKTWADLIDSYQRSSRFTALAPRTRKDYLKVLAYIESKWGKLDPRKLERHHVIKMQEANKDTVRFANYCVQVLSILCEHATDIGLMTKAHQNPAKGVRSLKSDRPPRQPWPQDLIEAFRQEAPIGTRARLIFELCLGSGQRIADVLGLRWSDAGADGISLRQSKTGTSLFVPYTHHLRDVLSQAHRRHIYIVADRVGRPITYRAAAHAIMQVRKRIGAEAYDIHALRHAAASELAEAGCTDEQIAAITGHASTAMVRRYSGAARQKARAKEAQSRRT